jgi:transcriptional regulator with GAF, ATPase, and Fis domain
VEAEVIDQFTDIVLGGHRARQLGERTLDVVLALTHGRAAAIFRPQGDGVSLFASRGIDQSVLDAMAGIHARERASLERGEAFVSPSRQGERRLPPGSEEAERGVVVLPVREKDALVALLYVDSERPDFSPSREVGQVARFARLVARSVQPGESPAQERESWQEYLERTPVEDMEREKMLLLLERNEWNIARVSRLMGVTRRTVYLRLARYQITRQKIRKTKPRAKRAG